MVFYGLDVNDEALILKRIAKGDTSAMEMLYRRYAGYATAVARRYVPDTNDMRDVLQDSFVKVITNIDKFTSRGEGSLKAWILRIVANEAISMLRRTSRLTFTDEVPEYVIGEEEPDVEYMPPEILNDMIGKLPTGYRTVLNLFVFENKSHKEIAKILGIKEDSSASQFYRAKKMLAHMINDYKVRRKA